LELKNLSPHFKSHPIDVFACVSLSRGMPPNAKKQVPKPATSEVYLTPVKRVMPQAQPQRERPLSPGGKGNGSPGKSTADGVWRTHAVLRFPLPEHALYATCVGDVLLQPPRVCLGRIDMCTCKCVHVDPSHQCFRAQSSIWRHPPGRPGGSLDQYH
jgi:hypothetical protein